MTEKEEKMQKDIYQFMQDQDGTDLQKFQLLKNSMTIQQICGALAVFSLNFCNLSLSIKKISKMIFNQKDTCFKEALASRYHPVL